MFTILPNRLKKAGRWLSVVALLPLLPLAAQAQAPANDDPAGAITLPIAATCTPVNGTNVGATTTSVATFGYTNPGCGIAASPRDVWYKFTTAALGQQGSSAVTITVTGTPAGQVRVFSSTGGAAGPFTSVGCAAGTANNTAAAPLNLTGLMPATTYYVFVSGFGSSDTQGAFTICATTPTLPASDVAVAAVQTLSKLPIPQGAPHVVRAVVTNTGLSTQSNIVVTLNVTGANTFTNTQTVASLASGVSTTVSFAPFTPTVAGTNTVTVSVVPDAITTNDSRSTTQLVNATTFSYADASMPTSARGFGPSATATSAFLASFTAGAATTVTDVRAFLVDFVGMGAGSTIGKTVYGVVVNPTTGAVLGRSADFVVTAASLNTYTTLPLTTPVAVAPGAFLVGLVQTYQTGQTTQYFPIGTQPEVPGRPNTFFTSSISTPATPVDIGVTNSIRFMLEAVTAPAGPVTCSPVTALTAGSITNTGASISFTAPTGATAYTVTYTAAGSTTPVTVTPAVTASPVVLTGLTAGTAYTVSVTNNCGGTNGNSVATTATFTTTGTPPGPANDECAGAVALTVGTMCTNITASNTGATASAGVPAPSSGANGCFLATTPISNDVWFSMVVPANGALTVTTSAIAGSPVNDTGLIIYSGTCASLTEVGCDDDASATIFFSSAALTGLTPGSTVYARVWSFGTTPTGQFNICATSPVGPVCADPTNAVIGTVTNTSATITFTPGAGNTSYIVTATPVSGPAITVTPNATASPITITGLTPGTAYILTIQSVCAAGGMGAVLGAQITTQTVAPPANDNPSGAITLTVAATCTPTNGTNAGATTTTPNGYVNPSTTPSTCGIAINPSDVWYRFVATAATATVTVTGNPAGAVRVFSAATNAGPFTQVTCTASTANNTVAPALPLTGLTVGTTYYIAVSGRSSGDTQGAFTICVTGASTNAPVTGLVVGNVTGTSASVVFTAPTGTPAPTGYTVTLTPTMPGGLPIVVTGTSSPIVIPNLTPGTTYTVTVVANYAGGVNSGPTNATFTTLLGARATMGSGSLSLYPNPAQQRFTLSVPAVAGARSAQLTLVNALGQNVLTRTVALQADGTRVAVEVEGLATGIYTLRVRAGAESAAIKVAIGR